MPLHLLQRADERCRLVAHRVILHRRMTSVANGAERKSIGSHLSQKAALVTHNGLGDLLDHSSAATSNSKESRNQEMGSISPSLTENLVRPLHQ